MLVCLSLMSGTAAALDADTSLGCVVLYIVIVLLLWPSAKPFVVNAFKC